MARKDGYKGTKMTASYKGRGANVKESRLNKGGNMSYKGKKK